MDHRIEADFQTLLMQAADTTQLYLSRAIHDIDEALSPGYAAKHPELVAAFITTAARDFHSSMVGVALQQLTDAVQDIADHFERSVEISAQT
jgi:hypothetical protein